HAPVHDGAPESPVTQLEDLARRGKDDAARALEGQLDDLHDKMDEWAQAAQSSGARARDDALARLKAEEADLRTEIEELRHSGDDAWKQLCRDTEERSSRFAGECRKLFEQR